MTQKDMERLREVSQIDIFDEISVDGFFGKKEGRTMTQLNDV